MYLEHMIASRRAGRQYVLHQEGAYTKGPSSNEFEEVEC